MFENIINFFKKLSKKNKPKESSVAAKERLHLVLMQDRANVSADFLELMRQEIIEVIKKYIDIDEKAIDVKLTNKTNEDGTVGAPALYANIPIITIKNDSRKLNVEKPKQEIKKAEETKKDKEQKVENKSEEKQEKVENETLKSSEEENSIEKNTDKSESEIKEQNQEKVESQEQKTEQENQKKVENQEEKNIEQTEKKQENKEQKESIKQETEAN